jgi:hypothetical protein
MFCVNNATMFDFYFKVNVWIPCDCIDIICQGNVMLVQEMKGLCNDDIATLGETYGREANSWSLFSSNQGKKELFFIKQELIKLAQHRWFPKESFRCSFLGLEYVHARKWHQLTKANRSRIQVAAVAIIADRSKGVQLRCNVAATVWCTRTRLFLISKFDAFVDTLVIGLKTDKQSFWQMTRTR